MVAFLILGGQILHFCRMKPNRCKDAGKVCFCYSALSKQPIAIMYKYESIFGSCENKKRKSKSKITLKKSLYFLEILLQYLVLFEILCRIISFIALIIYKL